MYFLETIFRRLEDKSYFFVLIKAFIESKQSAHMIKFQGSSCCLGTETSSSQCKLLHFRMKSCLKVCVADKSPPSLKRTLCLGCRQQLWLSYGRWRCCGRNWGGGQPAGGERHTARRLEEEVTEKVMKERMGGAAASSTCDSLQLMKTDNTALLYRQPVIVYCKILPKYIST